MAARYFLNCRGVFQGGGCKAVAYIGAYRRAIECGIGFTEFAGTSAGSIIAALAAAGATADEMEDFLYSIPIPSLANVEKGGWWKRLFLKTNLWIIKKSQCIDEVKPKKWSNLGAIAIEKLGILDSVFIKTHVDAFLRRKLGKDAEVRFSDLKYPLKIVAADLQEHRVKVWSSQDDYDYPVGKAVQCSCTFPFMFRPVDGRYVDGGVLSNLPIIFFPNKQGDIERTLAFSLIPQHEGNERNALHDYVSSIVNTTIEGASQIQLDERQKTVVISVETRLGLFDFGELNRNSFKCAESIRLGIAAVDNFLRNELREFWNSGEKSRDYFTNVEQIYNQVIFFSQWVKRGTHIVIATKTLQWVWNLFVVLAYLSRRGAYIDVYAEQYGNNGESKDLQESRIRTLSHLGGNVHIMTQGELPAYGFYFQRNGVWRGIAINKVKNNDKMAVFGRLLSADLKVNSKIVSGLVAAIKSSANFQDLAGLQQVPFTIHRLNNINKIQDKLRSKSYYSRATFHLDVLNIEDLLFLTDSVHGYKYRSMHMLDDMYGGQTDYYPAEIELAGGKRSLMCPILVDDIQGSLYVVEGYARLLYTYKNGGRTATCVVARNTGRVVTTDVYHISELKISDKNFEMGTIVALRPDRNATKSSRGIERSLRPPKKYLK